MRSSPVVLKKLVLDLAKVKGIDPGERGQIPFYAGL